MDTYINNAITALSQSINAVANTDWWQVHSNCPEDTEQVYKNLQRAKNWIESARDYIEKYEQTLNK